MKGKLGQRSELPGARARGASEGAPANHAKLLRILEPALERGALDPLALDIRELTSFADTFVLLTGRSDRQVRAIADAVVDALREDDEEPIGIEGLAEGRWVLIDCNDVVVHVFVPEMRELYALERLWSDAPRVDLAGIGVSEAALDAARSETGLAGETR